MKLNLDNFCSDLIFCPWKADTRKGKLVATVSCIACWTLTLGICPLVCAIRNCYYKPPHKMDKLDHKVADTASNTLTDSSKSIELETMKENPIPDETDSSEKIEPEVLKTMKDYPIPNEVQKVLNGLFDETDKSWDTLPIYPELMTKDRGVPKRETMTAPIMKGACPGGQQFLAIKVESDTPEGPNKQLLILHQYTRHGSQYWGGKNENIWVEINNSRLTPQYLTWNLTYPGSGEVTDSQAKNYVLLQQLIREGSSQDIREVTWRLSKSS